MAKGNIKFDNAILCEDIRIELDGRFSLMGVISGEIIFSANDETDTLPKHRIGFFIQGKAIGTMDISLEFVDPDGGLIGRAHASIEPVGSGDTLQAFAFPVMPREFEFSKSGKYKIVATEKGKKAKTLQELDVTIIDNKSAT